MKSPISYRGALSAAALATVAFVAGRLTHSAVSTAQVAENNAESSREIRSPQETQPVLKNPTRDADVLTGLLATPAERLVAIAEGIGRLVALDTAATLRAWQSLGTRVPRSDYVGSLVAAYLWSRQAAINPETPLPEGWGLESFPGLKASLAIRDNLDQIRSDLLAGKKVPYAERRMFFEDAVSKDPVGSFAIWLKNHTKDDILDELPWFQRAMEDPAHRDDLLAAIEGSVGDAVWRSDLLEQLIRGWAAADAVAALEWISNPKLAAYKERLRVAYADTLCRVDPQAAWSLSEDLPRDVRLAAQFSASQILAQQNPQMGIARVNAIKDPKQREEVVSYFGETLAIYHYDEWQKWRDTLPPDEQNKVNEAAFESWVGADAPAALAWLEKRPPGPAKLGMISEFASKYSSGQPEVVSAWIRTLPSGNDRLTAVVAGLRGMSDADHQGIRKLLEAAR
jgi:hypothetical protein